VVLGSSQQGEFKHAIALFWNTSRCQKLLQKQVRGGGEVREEGGREGGENQKKSIVVFPREFVLFCFRAFLSKGCLKTPLKHIAKQIKDRQGMSQRDERRSGEVRPSYNKSPPSRQKSRHGVDSSPPLFFFPATSCPHNMAAFGQLCAGRREIVQVARPAAHRRAVKNPNQLLTLTVLLYLFLLAWGRECRCLYRPSQRSSEMRRLASHGLAHTTSTSRDTSLTQHQCQTAALA
jgi:hypothetical protein